MNRALLNKVLIGGLVVIWSLVGYKFFKPAKEIQQKTTEQAAMVVAKEEIVKPEFEWTPLERDPFLNTITRQRSTTATTTKPKGRQRASSENTSTIWPTIEYFGFVRKQNQPAPLALIKINNNLQRLRAGQSFQSIEVLKVYEDSIQIKFGGEIRVVRK